LLALVVASRFGLLLGLSLWLGLGVSLLLMLPIVERQLPSPQARELAGAVIARLDKVLLGAVALVLVGLAARVLIDRAAPPTNLVVPVAVMTLSRLLSALTVSPASRALLGRLIDANAPASEAERSAFSRLQGARGLLLALEVCLGFYALYAVS
jgi:hypothetical protein